MPDHSILGLCGSLRSASTNRMLLNEARRLFDPAHYTDGNLRLPLYDGDLEDNEGVPEAAMELARQIQAADAVIIACPEYNKALSGVMKNALDWISRTKIGPWRDKPVAIMSATGGRAGGERSQYSLRLCLNPFRPRVLPGPEVCVGNSSGQFDENGRLTDERALKLLTELMDELKAEIRRSAA